MALKIYSAPTIEPITATEAKLHCRIDSGSFADDITSTQSIFPGDHIQAAAYSLKGAGVDVLGKQTLVLFEWAGFGLGSTVDVKLQESDTDVDGNYVDVTSGGFTQVNTATANANFEKAYTGTKQYLRVVSTVATATADFGVSIVTSEPTSAEDTLIDALITTARRYCEQIINRALITQTWDLWLDKFPVKDYLEVPLPPLQEPSVTAGAFVTSTKYRITSIGSTNFILIGASANTVGVVFTATGAGAGTGTATASPIITYYDTDDTAAEMSAGDYFVDIISNPARIYLNWGKSWATTTLRPANGVNVRFICGYGDTAATVPQEIRQAMLLIIGHLYEHREETTDKALQNVPMAVDALLYPYRIWSF
jgi:hypothetical protein